MKKSATIFIFIFMTGLFAGIFFSTNLSYENNEYLSSLLLASFTDNAAGFGKIFFSALVSNFILMLIMLPAIVTKFLCPIPPVILWFKSFSIGFCSGLVYLNANNAILISLTKIFPPNLFIIPAFLIISTVIFHCSTSEAIKKNRPYQENKSLLILTAISVILVLAGCITESICHSAAL
ncbi:stage II sporulation protein M [Mogibacterium sp. NSJ-24]|uniref:Stage II sporulation protein M n=2 Tax=Anaerovoracaceae TaxID=543314 RepID=A0A926E5U4_9FIRM|nr:stage II sporulation protein M [Lentihominibacter hominis]